MSAVEGARMRGPEASKVSVEVGRQVRKDEAQEQELQFKSLLHPLPAVESGEVAEPL